MHTVEKNKTSGGHQDDRCYICMGRQPNISYHSEDGQDIKQ